jgi:hypothetical protein
MSTRWNTLVEHVGKSLESEPTNVKINRTIDRISSEIADTIEYLSRLGKNPKIPPD